MHNAFFCSVIAGIIYYLFFSYCVLRRCPLASLPTDGTPTDVVVVVVVVPDGKGGYSSDFRLEPICHVLKPVPSWWSKGGVDALALVV